MLANLNPVQRSANVGCTALGRAPNDVYMHVLPMGSISRFPLKEGLRRNQFRRLQSKTVLVSGPLDRC